ncbi:MAG: MaoC family dehydratase [Caldilineales bacterium]|nr:MaoC family dehydratase [Caldilineales bacterium]
MSGKYYDELNVGERIKHGLGRTVTEMDNTLFSALTMNTQPLHINEDFAAKTQFGQRIVNGIFTLGLVIGITVPDLTEGTIVANLGYDGVRHPHPVYHGDTLYVETEILDKRLSRSNPGRGIVQMKHIGRNQHGTIVLEVVRTALFLVHDA